MTLIDSHCHLEMLDDAGWAVEQAREAGVETVVSIGIDAASSKLAVGFAERLEGVYATVGLHPHDAGSLGDALLGELEELAAHPRVVAIGECGLDFYRDLSPRHAQRRAFGAQIELARRAGLRLVALVIHPVIPGTAEEILRRLGQAHGAADLLLEKATWTGLTPAAVVVGPPLFPRIEAGVAQHLEVTVGIDERHGLR